MADIKNRQTRVRESPWFNGIDFVEVADDSQTALRVHFLNATPLDHTLGSPPVTITGGESIPTVPVNPIDESTAWTVDGSHLVLTLTVAAPGDFSNYLLRIHQKESIAGRTRLDPHFDHSDFSFKAGCPSDLDNQPQPAACPEPPSFAPPIDYLAKDFLSFRQVLLDFSALRYPEWQERSESDFGVMFLEALCALGDDLSYSQDRIAAEAFLPTATQRRSIVRNARIVDYWPAAARVSTVLLQFDVHAGVTSLEDGLVVTAPGPDGTPIPFETGASLTNRRVASTKDVLRRSPPATTVSAAWNRKAILPYWFDDGEQYLPAGATQMYVLGVDFGFQCGQSLLIETQPLTGVDPPTRQTVRLLDFQEHQDLLETSTTPPGASHSPFSHPDSATQGTALTLIRWRSEDALVVGRDLKDTTLAGNLVAATQGRTQPPERFCIPDLSVPRNDAPPAIVRTGPNDTPTSPSLQYLYSLRSSPLAWVPSADPTRPQQPEMVLTSQAPGTEKVVVWRFLRWLLDAQPSDLAFTVDAARYACIGGPGDAPHHDYAGDSGDTLRFGDGNFGVLPEPGTTFTATYRLGGGASGNVAADSITSVVPLDPRVIRVSNPLPATGGADAEPLETVRRLAPQAFRAEQFRAVLPADYEAASLTLPWVRRAGSVFRWTGSWLTAFTTPDPTPSEQLTAVHRGDLIDLLNRYRMAGYESYVSDPEYVSIDLVVRVCAQSAASHATVEQAVLTSLGTSPAGFFTHGRFKFGQPLESSALEAAVQLLGGVAGVLEVRYRFSGRTSGFTPIPDSVTVGTNQIIRCDNDPNLPGNGSLQVIIEGGK